MERLLFEHDFVCRFLQIIFFAISAVHELLESFWHEESFCVETAGITIFALARIMRNSKIKQVFNAIKTLVALIISTLTTLTAFYTFIVAID